MYYDDYFDEDEAIIEAALDIYDEYDVSMEEAIDIAMEKVVYTPGGFEMKKLREKDPNVDWENTEYLNASYKNDAFWNALRHAKNGGNNDPDRRMYLDSQRERYGDFGWKQGKKSNRKIKLRDIDRGNPTPNKRRIDPKTGIAVGAGAAALGAGIALYKYRKKKLAEKAMKRAKAENAVAQAKEASIYFDYD